MSLAHGRIPGHACRGAFSPPGAGVKPQLQPHRVRLRPGDQRCKIRAYSQDPMRKGLIILLMLMVVSPDPSGVLGTSPVQACECQPSACHCMNHDHGSGHEPLCAFANGGKCGVRSTDFALAAMTGRFQFLVTETPGLPLLFWARLEPAHLTTGGLSGHHTPPKPPPRFAV